ncbi:hypothetical protein HMPREF2604_07435 [Corynebacterium sp. HMSC055A01]|uniref:hypothetical protein n=1 Tax=Corynebacterium sp. HMSC055A01 TaxID=1715083 RepID=UPI0008A1D6A9|nr:hypothetical protein [Corynebacterium sp. HMSC055A01]OFN17764.1 hypothetical protein HMPREF2604_07435 [Corynebacterium sp. HMSC055A01]
MNIKGFRITNRGRAALIAVKENNKQDEEVPAHYRIANELAEAGLLAEDLPEPSRGMGSGGAVWYLPGPVGDIRSYGEHIVVFGHDCQEKPFRLVLNAPEAVAIGRTILAAAKHEEGKA